MFDHVTIRVSDRDASEQFYDVVLAALGIDETYRTNTHAEWQEFMLSGTQALHPITRNLHIGFVSPTHEQVDGFWRAGMETGYTDDGAPGPRPEYGGDYYGAFLRDPDGNSVEAVYHHALRRGGIIDHLWIRVADLGASSRFYKTIAPQAHLRLTRDTPERVQFEGTTGSFSLLPGTPTEHLHMAFPTSDDSDVQSFHQTAVDAGYRSEGTPGERRRYHPGYYAAYVLDPDGNNIEVVNHHRS